MESISFEQMNLMQGVKLTRDNRNWTPADFEKAIHHNTEGSYDYIGTSPRQQKSGRVFTASEFNAQHPVPVHCEMSFLKSYPKKIWFYCRKAAAVGGETPLVDYRKVYRSLPDKLKKKLAERGVQYTRIYKSKKQKSFLNFTSVKSWEELFGTEDRKKIAAQCNEQDQLHTWNADGSITIAEKRPAFVFPEDLNEWIHFNHIQSFHPLSIVYEARRLFLKYKSFSSLRIYFAGMIFIGWRYYLVPTRKQATFVTFGDGTRFTRAEVLSIQKAIWENAVYYKLKEGELLELDNRFIGHGRLPFSGEREIWVTWTE